MWKEENSIEIYLFSLILDIPKRANTLMIMKKLYLLKTLLFSISFVSFLFMLPEWATAKQVDSTAVCRVAENLFYERGNFKQNVEFNSEVVSTVIHNDTMLYYVVEVNQSHYAVIAADNRVYPVLSYAYNPYPEAAFPPAYQEWMKNVREQILYVLRKQLTPDAYVTDEWKYYLNKSLISKSNYKAVSPLLNATWHQGDPYNMQCPYSANSVYANNHVPVGCVAVAMGQIMQYHGHPASGTGSHSYTSSYGTESANFGNTTYDWSNMPGSVTSSSPASQKNEVAKLLYHCGVSVDMNYGDNGSGSYSGDAMLALGNYFKYNSSLMSYEAKASASNWDYKIKNDIDNGRPVFYRGEKSNGGGHAFVLDGYQGSNNDHYHFNWGWGSYYNNYCYLNALIPANITGYNYTYNQHAIFGIEPAGTANLIYWSKQIIDDNTGQSSGDGDGQAEPGETIELIITLKNTGNSAASAVNATLSTSDPDITITDDNEDFGSISANSTANCLYDYDFTVSNSCMDKDVTFTLDITDANNNSWTETFIVHIYGNSSYCSGTTTITTTSGTFSDGSGTNDYADDSDCKWLIQPSGVSSITLNFTSFDTESGYDLVKVYDGSTTSASLLGTFSGSSLPSAVSSTGGTMLVHFTSDYSNTADGWVASFTTGSSNQPEVIFESGVIDDDNNEQSSGNDDGYADAGETIEFLLELKNVGNATAYGVSAHISTTDPDLTITDADEDFGDISPQGTAWCNYDYDIEISSTCPTKTADIIMTITDNNGHTWTETLVLYLYGTSTAYCSGLTTLTASSGSIDDGSGGSDYGNDSDCRWLINPTGAANVSLTFTSFDTEDGYDYVKIYDGNSTSDPLLGEYCGSSIPPAITSSGGQMLVSFISDYDITAAGFSASYTSGGTGIMEFSHENISIYPNPGNGNFTLSVEDFRGGQINLQLINMQGQVIYSKDLKNLAAGNFKKNIRPGNIASGIYYLDIVSDDMQLRKKLVVY